MSRFKLYLHKGCSGKFRASSEFWDGVYLYGKLEVVCSLEGNDKQVAIHVEHNWEEYSYPVITAIMCHDCGEELRALDMPAHKLEARIAHDPDSYGLVYCESDVEQP